MSKTATFANDQFNWIEISKGDYECKICNYLLRVEQMDANYWWFAVYVNDTELESAFTGSKYRAVGICEGIYIGLSNLVNNKES